MWFTQVSATPQHTTDDMPCVREQVHNTTAFFILEKLIQHAEAGGRIVKCGDGKTRKVLLLFGQYVTDRQEHEMVLLVKAFSCWHCHCAKADRDDRGGSTGVYNKNHKIQTVLCPLGSRICDGFGSVFMLMEIYCLIWGQPS